MCNFHWFDAVFVHFTLKNVEFIITKKWYFSLQLSPNLTTSIYFLGILRNLDTPYRVSVERKEFKLKLDTLYRVLV